MTRNLRQGACVAKGADCALKAKTCTRQRRGSRSQASGDKQSHKSATAFTGRVGDRGRLAYYVHKGNNANLVRRQFRHRASWEPAVAPWQLASLNDGAGLRSLSELAGAADMIWCQYRSQLGPFEQYLRSRRRQGAQWPVLLNHFDNVRVLVHKSRLYETLGLGQIQSLAPWTRVVRLVPKDVTPGSVEPHLRDLDIRDEVVYIVKPGESSNRGFGIRLARGVSEVARTIEHAAQKSKRSERSWIVQEYIARPLLLRRRKFDVRCYALLVFDSSTVASRDGESSFHAFLHKLAYLRTAASEFSLASLGDRITHLTNDAVQKTGKDYLKDPNRNKLSLADFEEILDSEVEPGAGSWVHESFWPEVTKSVKQTLAAGVAAGINSSNYPRCFELFGFDFMVNDAREVKLIEVNDNPCLEQVCPLLAELIPKLVADTMDIVLDRSYSGAEHSAASGSAGGTDNGYQKLF